MADLAHLGLAIDSRPATQAAAALDRMAEAAARGESRVGQIRTAADALIAALNRNTAATESLTAKMVAMEAAGSKAGASLTSMGAAADAGAGKIIRLNAAGASTKASLDGITGSARNATAAWAALGAMGAATAEKLEIARRMASASASIVPPPVYRVDQAAGWAMLSGQGSATAQRLDVARRMSTASAIGTPGVVGLDSTRAQVDPVWASQERMNKALADANRLRQAGLVSEASYTRFVTQQAQAHEEIVKHVGGAAGAGGPRFSRAQQANLGNLAQQSADVAVTAGMGMSPFMIALQQGPQILQSFAGPGALKISEVFDAAGEKAGALAMRIGLVGGAFAAMTTAAVAGVAAQQSYSMTQIDLAQKLSGVGRVSGATAGQINAIAESSADAGNISVRSARAMAGEFAATGRIGSEMYAGLIGTAKDYAATTGQEMPEATKTLAAAFADPAKGAEVLNQQLGFLDAATRRNINSLSAQGDRLGAQKVLFEAYKGSLTSATELTSAWGRVTGAVTKSVSNAWDAVGSVVDRVVTGGDLETQIATAEKVLAASQARQAYLPFGMGERDTALARAELDRLRAEQARIREQGQRTDIAQRTLVVDDLVKQFNPAQERVKQIEQAAARIRTELKEGVLDPDGRSLRTAEGLEAAARRIREDMTQGGTQFANAIREAQFGLRTVGFSPQAQRVAGINERAENEIRALQVDPNDPLLRDYQINAIRERSRIELETARQQATISENAIGGAFSRMSDALQQQILRAANDYGRIPAGVIAAIAAKESSSNPNVGYSRSLGEDGRPSSAYGLGQITRGTAEEAVRLGYLPRGYDRTNVSTMAEGIAGVLSMKMDQNGGDLNRAIMAYRGSNSAAINQRYLVDVQRSSGQIGDNSVGALAKDSVARAEALKNERRIVEINTQHLGRNGQALEEQTRYQQLLNQAISEGREVTPALRDELQQMARGMVSASRALRATEAGRSLEFERDQLGRTRGEQAAYGRARSLFGDVTSPMAQAYIREANDNAELYEAKSSLTDAMGGFVMDLRRGASAADAASSALGRFADRALNALTDTLVSGLFSAGGSSKGGVAGFFGGLLGIGGGSAGASGLIDDTAALASVPMFANGGIMTSRGRLPLNTYANGGVANSPQLAVFGEGRMPEAYVPLPDGRRIPVAMQGGGAANGNGPVTDARTFTFDMRGSTLTEEQARQMFMEALAKSEAGQAAAMARNNAQRDRNLAQRLKANQRRHA